MVIYFQHPLCQIHRTSRKVWYTFSSNHNVNKLCAAFFGREGGDGGLNQCIFVKTIDPPSPHSQNKDHKIFY